MNDHSVYLATAAKNVEKSCLVKWYPDIWPQWFTITIPGSIMVVNWGLPACNVRSHVGSIHFCFAFIQICKDKEEGNILPPGINKSIDSWSSQ